MCSTEVSLAGASDHALLVGGLWDQVEASRASARRLARMDEFRRRRERQEQPGVARPRATLTPLQDTVVEVGALWGESPGRVRRDLGTVRALRDRLPMVWELCIGGKLDGYRASLIADTARYALDHPEAYARFEQRIGAWLTADLGGGPCACGDPGCVRPELVTKTVKQISNKVAYELKLLLGADTDAAHRRAFADRTTTASEDPERGMGALHVEHSLDQIRLADHRLNLAARAARAAGDPRTVRQLRADLAIEVLLGRVHLDPDDATPTRGNTPLGAYARPVVHLTVPIQTVLGISDHPGVLSGGTVVPPSLARRIAADPDSTWYRMLTDPTDRCVELSTTSYRPTPVIWNQVLGRHTSCFRRNCDRPAAESDAEHRVPWPHGPTSTTNLWPACRRDHRAKHAPGYSIVQNPDGSFSLATPAGFIHPTEPTEHPVEQTWPELPDAIDADNQIQFTATELLDTLTDTRTRLEADRPERNDLWLENNDPVWARLIERISA